MIVNVKDVHGRQKRCKINAFSALIFIMYIPVNLVLLKLWFKEN